MTSNEVKILLIRAWRDNDEVAEVGSFERSSMVSADIRGPRAAFSAQ